MKHKILLIIIFITGLNEFVFSKDYYVHPLLGNDSNDGSSKELALKTLKRASELALVKGDRILLAKGQIFNGTLSLKRIHGSSAQPIIIESVDWSDNKSPDEATIDFKGQPQGILIEDCSHVKVSSIRIIGNGFLTMDSTIKMRVGVLIKTNSNVGVSNITLDQLRIADIFYENEGFKRPSGEVKTANGTERYGWGIRLMNAQEDILIDQILIQNSVVENVGHTGIKLTGAGRNIQNVRIINNKILRTGGPGVQMSNVKFIYVADNEINKSGSADDGRKWGRGSGLWTWSASNVLIEKNKFLYANGPGDSAGAHIDYNCDNVILQYNLSAHNAGGFCEILGNNYNCAYRYNISVNDGHRIKDKDGAFQEGKTFWLSGYQGNKERKGPVNTYFYNNTIFVNESIVSKIAIDNLSEGILIANNIFFIVGKSATVKGDQYKPDDGKGGVIERVIFRNNLFLKKTSWPDDSVIKDAAPLYGDPQFAQGGSLSLKDYTPKNKNLGKGIDITLIPGDIFGLVQGLKMKEDILGNKITGQPGLGAISY